MGFPLRRYGRPVSDIDEGTAAAAVLLLPAGALLLVAGVPGAGKTTLLARAAGGRARVLDPEPIRARYARRLQRLPYPLWRPLVHAEHYLRVLCALPGPAGMVVHEPGTRRWLRRLLLAAASGCGRGAHLLLLDVSAEQALAGQRRRRRVLRRGAFARHWRRWLALRSRLAGADGASAVDPALLDGERWASVRLLDRAAAARLRRIDIPPRGQAPAPRRHAALRVALLALLLALATAALLALPADAQPVP
jgi:hypothetical protein